MPRHVATGLTLLLAAAVLAAAPAHAVIMGSSSSLGSYTVRLVGASHCTGIGHRAPRRGHRRPLRARHARDGRRRRAPRHRRCAQRAARRRPARARVGRRRHPATGRPASGRRRTGADRRRPRRQLHHRRLRHHRRARHAAPSVRCTRQRWWRQAPARWSIRTVAVRSAPARVLAIPAGRCCAAAWLVGIITRAAHPSPRIACGDLTRWAAITVSGQARDVAVAPAKKTLR